jgi:hypothetical protein
MLFGPIETIVILGWDFYLPVIAFVVMCALAVPVWASIGVAATMMLLMAGDLPLALLGESLFHGIDAFALTAVPLFILTGDVLVRTGLSRKFLDVAEALTQFAKGGFGSATVLVCGMFAAISGSDAAGAAAVGRMTIDRLVESGYPRPYACALVAAGACTGILIPPSSAYPWYFRLNSIFGSDYSRRVDPAGDPDYQPNRQPHLQLRRGRQSVRVRVLFPIGQRAGVRLVCFHCANNHLLRHLFGATYSD